MQAFKILSYVATNKVLERQELLQAEGNVKGLQNGRKDMLTELFNLRASKGDEGEFGFYDIVGEGNVGVFAGSDTTAIALRAIVHQLLTHPPVLVKLRKNWTMLVQKGV